MTFAQELMKMRACAGAVDWVADRTAAQSWADCKRADWMLWLLWKMRDRLGWPDTKTVYLCRCDCAETALRFVPEGEDRPRRAIETCRAWCRGEATESECAAAADAAFSASAAADYAAADAAFSASAAADYAAAADSASAAASAAAWAAASAAAADKTHNQMCDLIRSRVPTIPELEGELLS